MDFRNFLIERMATASNEADIILHQIIDNVDDAHIEYSEDRLDLNVGLIIKRSSYSNLFITIFNSDTNNVRVAKNNQKDGFTLVINTTKYPSRTEIDTFLSNKQMYKITKNFLMEYIEDYHEENEGEFKTEYEKVKNINNKSEFEDVYNRVVEKMKKRIAEYKEIASDMNEKLDNTANELQAQTLVRALEQLKDEYLGDTFKKFKRIANDEAGVDLTRFTKEFKAKYDARLESFYEHIVEL